MALAMDMNVNFRRHFESAVPDANPGDTRRPLDWAGLCATIAASQDLCRAANLEARRAAPAASASFCAEAVQALGESRRSESIVNLDPLSNGKAQGFTSEGTPAASFPECGIWPRGKR